MARTVQPVPTPSAPPPRGLRRWLPVLVLGAVALLLVVSGVVLLAVRAPAQVRVSGVRLTSSDGACGIRNQTLPGFVADAGATVGETLTITNPNATTSCVVHSLTVSTAGFRLSPPNVPLTISPRQTGFLRFDLGVPDTGFIGPVDLELE